MRAPLTPALTIEIDMLATDAGGLGLKARATDPDLGQMIEMARAIQDRALDLVLSLRAERAKREAVAREAVPA